jgi:two-component system sensor histidine kinase KdpD
VDVSIAQWVLDHGESAGAGTGTLAAAPARYLPLKAPMRVRGVLVVAPRAEPPWRRPEDLETLEACAGQIAVALERVHFVEVARDTLVQMEGERLRNTLLLSLSHDLRTPVAGMLGTAELALQRGAEGPARPLLQALVEQARAMQSLLDNLLQLARLQSGQARLDRQWHALEEIVASALGHVRSACAGHGLEVRLAAGLPLVEVDALLLERALVNLLDNACKHTPAGCRIAVDARLDPGGTLVIEVADDGPGWPGDDPSRLFAPFQRGAAESPMTGMGLGLALVERIAALHGGRGEARKREPQGSVFALHLPQRPAPQEGVET